MRGCSRTAAIEFTQPGEKLMIDLSLRLKANYVLSLALIWAVLALLAVTTFAQTPQPYFTEPAISPDDSEIAFVSGGDIWTVPAAGGEARLLVSHPSLSPTEHSQFLRRTAFSSVPP